MRINPVIKPVLETFQSVYYQTLMFANNPTSAINGLLVMGDAGTGKSHWVKQALIDAGVQQNVEYIKGGTITAASLYVKLYVNRHSHRIIVFDDVDLLGHPERNKIIPSILGAVEEGRDRLVTWNTAKKNALMEEFDVPFEFKFNGNVIFITNYTRDTIKEKAKVWAPAFNSRFTSVECNFTPEQKYLYTRHLVDNENMLADKCKVHKYVDADGNKHNGYPQEVVDEAMNFIDDNYQNFTEVTPRIAVKIADVIHYNTDPHMKRVMLHNIIH